MFTIATNTANAVRPMTAARVSGGNMKRRVIFVDDEQNILDGLQRMLRGMRNEWEMEFVSSGVEALARMEQQPFDVLVTDMRMPGMDGIAVLQAVRARYPHTIRFVLSGHSDRETICNTVGITHQFLSKPTDSTIIRNTIERAFSLRTMLSGVKLQGLVSQIKHLPSLPDIYMKVASELRATDPSVQKIGKLIEKDMAMSAKVLQLVNSAFFGVRQRVTSPVQVASLLGLDILSTVLLMIPIFDQVQGVRFGGFSLEALWTHSFTVGTYAQLVARAEKCPEPMVNDILSAGVFHDLGKLVLVTNLPQQYAQALQLAAREHVSISDAEGAVFGATHAEVGAYLLGLWGFGDAIVEASAYHHHPSKSVTRVFGPITAVHAANALDNFFTQHNTPDAAIDMSYLREVGLDSQLPTWRSACEAYRARKEAGE